MLSGALFAVMASGAYAQDTSAPPPPSAAPAPTAQTEKVQAKTEGDSVEALVVTGSRIRRNEFTSSSPIQVITRDVSTQAGLVSAAQILQGSTIAQGSEQISGFYNSGVVTDGGGGIKTVSLRGLGANRTLVLLNGRRLAPAGMGGTVGAGADLNVVPSALVQRYEILKDGASSVYGSDAVAGVANIITRTNLNGWEFEANGSAPQHGGGESYLVSGAYGKTFDRGSFMAAVEYNRQEALRQGDRKWSKCGFDYVHDPKTGARLDYTNPVGGGYKCVNGTYAGIIVTPFGDIMPAPGDTAVFGYVPNYHDVYYDSPRIPGGVDETPYGSPWDDKQTIVTPDSTFTVSAFANRDLDILGGAEFYSEFLFSDRKSESLSVGQFFPTIGIEDPRNPLLPIYEDGYPEDYATAIPVSPQRYWSKQDVDYTRLVLGLRGDLSLGSLKNWSWDASYQYSLSKARYSGNQMLSDRVAYSLDVQAAPGGGYQCANAGARANGCLPIPVFDPAFLTTGAMSQATYDYVWSTEIGHTEFSSHLFNASATGDLFQLPAGAVAAAIGFEVRRDRIDDEPSFNAQARNLYGYTSAGETKGSENVGEIFGELSVPLLAKLPLIEALNLDASARYTKYDKTGYSDVTYKAGLNWTLNSALRLRTTYGTSFRAPALYELFLGGQTSFTSAADPCRQFDSRDPNTQLYKNCLAEIGHAGTGTLADPYFQGYRETPQVITYGNNDGRLDAETSDSFSAGLIWTPSFFDVNLAVDYFLIHVDGEIGKYGAVALLSACYNDPKFRAAGTLCDFVSPRTPYNPATKTGGQIDEINDSYFNINKQYTAGFDVTTRIVQDLTFKGFDIGKFSFDTRTTITTTDKIKLTGAKVTDYNGTWSDPKVVSQLDFKLEHKDWELFWRASYTDEQSNYRLYAAPNDKPSTSMYDILIEERWYHDASVQYSGNDYEITLGVKNVFDEIPDTVSSAFARVGAAGFTSQVEPFGRTVFVALHKTLP